MIFIFDQMHIILLFVNYYGEIPTEILLQKTTMDNNITDTRKKVMSDALI